MIRYYLDQAIVSSLSVAATWQSEVYFSQSSFALRSALLSTSRDAATGSRTRACARRELT